MLSGDGSRVEAEVVGFSGDRLYLMPTGDVHGLDAERARDSAAARRQRARRPAACWAASSTAPARRSTGSVRSSATSACKLHGQSRSIRWRASRSTQPLDIGVRAINALLTVGRGQRIGLFAGRGVGKSVLLGMMARYTSADVIVVGLIGERGREVKEFVERILGPEGRRALGRGRDARPTIRR